MQAFDGGNDIKGEQHAGEHHGYHTIEEITHLLIQVVDISELGDSAVAITLVTTTTISSAPLCPSYIAMTPPSPPLVIDPLSAWALVPSRAPVAVRKHVTSKSSNSEHVAKFESKRLCQGCNAYRFSFIFGHYRCCGSRYDVKDTV